jgi:dihydrofolate reductase
MHISLDGYVAGPNGEMDWIRFDGDLIDDVKKITDSSDTALFGRKTYEMMAYYWPTAAEQPDASQHDKDHAAWVNPAPKLVFSKMLAEATWNNSRIIRDNFADEIAAIKSQPGKNLLMIGSATTAHEFMRQNLIDHYRININPVVLGGGMPLFPKLETPLNLELSKSRTYENGVLGLDYLTKR